MCSVYYRIIIGISFITLISSCSLIHFLSVSDKKSEKLVQANKYLAELSVDTCLSYQIVPESIDSLSYTKYQIDTYKLEHGTSATPVQLRMYYPNGKFCYGWTQCFGSIERLGLLDSLPLKKVSHLPVNYNLSFYNDLSLFNIDNSEKEKLIKSIKNYDYVLIVFWAEWTGWYSKNLFKNVIKYIHKHKEKKILLLTLNVSP